MSYAKTWDFEFKGLATQDVGMSVWLAVRSFGKECWASRATLAQMTGLTERVVARALVSLKKRGMLVTRREGFLTKRAAVSPGFASPPAELDEPLERTGTDRLSVPPQTAQAAHGSTLDRVNKNRKQTEKEQKETQDARETSPQPQPTQPALLEVKPNQPAPKPSSKTAAQDLGMSAADRDVVTQLWDYWQTQTGFNGRLDKKRAKELRNGWRDLCDRDLALAKRVIDGFAADDWWMGRRPGEYTGGPPSREPRHAFADAARMEKLLRNLGKPAETVRPALDRNWDLWDRKLAEQAAELESEWLQVKTDEPLQVPQDALEKFHPLLRPVAQRSLGGQRVLVFPVRNMTEECVREAAYLEIAQRSCDAEPDNPMVASCAAKLCADARDSRKKQYRITVRFLEAKHAKAQQLTTIQNEQEQTT